MRNHQRFIGTRGNDKVLACLSSAMEELEDEERSRELEWKKSGADDYKEDIKRGPIIL